MYNFEQSGIEYIYIMYYCIYAYALVPARLLAAAARLRGFGARLPVFCARLLHLHTTTLRLDAVAQRAG